MNKLNPIIAFLVISVISSASVAGDKYKPLREISPYATISTIPTIASTTNETGDPIVLPEDVIDKAIKTPAKDKDVELQKIPTVQEEQLAREIDNIFADKKVEVKKPSTHKERERAKKLKKRQTQVKTVRDNVYVIPEKQ
ncbi:MAG: hypothetical protein AABY33_01165 [Pseudomonadota bacterium]